MSTKKDKCKMIMKKLFGPATARLVDKMNENDCVTKCKKKTLIYLGEDKAKLFDKILIEV